MPIAKTVNEALDLLKSSVSDPVPEAPSPEVEEALEPNAVDSVAMVKAEEVEMLATKLKDSDEFFIGLAEHQEANVGKLVKGLEGNMNATHAVLSLFKGFAEKLDTLTDIVGKLADTPQPRRSVLSKSEASDAVKGIVSNNEDEPDQLHKADVVSALRTGFDASKCDANDVIKAEAGMSGGNSVDTIPLEVVFRQLSPGGQTIIKELIESRS
jgi:hypothetical protein